MGLVLNNISPSIFFLNIACVREISAKQSDSFGCYKVKRWVKKDPVDI